MSKSQDTLVRVVREGSTLEPDAIDDILGAIEAGFAEDSAAPSVAVVLGEGVRVGIHHGHLRVVDGLGWNRRERSWPKAGSGLRRLIIGAQSGMVTLDAISWCQILGVAIVVVDHEGEVVLSPGTYGHDDARLRRVQGNASEELAVSIANGLIGSKVSGQASVAGAVLDRPDVAETLTHIATALDDADSIDEVRQLEATAAACYFGAWVDHPAVVPRFTVADAKRVPEHWCHYDGRRSLLTKGNSNRKAERPANAVLNYLYRIAAIEARLACVAVGLDPGLGVLHMDAAGRDSLVLDVVEPVRPPVERFVINLMAEATFTRRDFIERSDGSVRIGPGLAQRLAATMPIWAREVAPYAEQVAHTFGRVVAGKWSPRTPLTGRNAHAAAAVVKARKVGAIERGRRSAAARAEAPHTDAARAALEFAACIDCGGTLERPRHLRCSTCWEKQPGQAREIRQRRGRAIARARSAQEEWKRDHPDASGDREEFRRRVLPGLASVTLSDIMAATGCAKATASSYRSGRTTPHPMFWDELGRLAKHGG
jgi:CRISPR-associated endonuclease Cas1